MVTICTSYFTTGGPCKEPPTGRFWERSKGDTMCPTTSQNPSHWHPSWLSNVCSTRKCPESEWLDRDNLENNPITIKPESGSHLEELFSWVPLPCCSPPGCPFPIKSLALSARVSPQTIHFWVLDKRPLRSWKGLPSCNNLKTFSWDLKYLVCDISIYLWKPFPHQNHILPPNALSQYGQEQLFL